MGLALLSSRPKLSPSSRRAWIEIFAWGLYQVENTVALLAEGVDRNFTPFFPLLLGTQVALLAEGVDRNA